MNKDHYAIFFYGEEGSRSRGVLKDFLSEAKDLKSIQSDGYNAYMYLDDELIDIEHLCCLAHARAKFWYAYDRDQNWLGSSLRRSEHSMAGKQNTAKGSLRQQKSSRRGMTSIPPI